MISKQLIDNIKKFFIITAYFSYVILTILKNEMNINLGKFEYIFVIIIGISLKLSQTTEVIEKIVNIYDETMMNKIESHLSTVSSQLSEITKGDFSNRSNILSTPKSPEVINDVKEMTSKNEPVEEIYDSQTHRDFDINSQYVLRIKNIV